MYFLALPSAFDSAAADSASTATSRLATIPFSSSSTRQQQGQPPAAAGGMWTAWPSLGPGRRQSSVEEAKADETMAPESLPEEEGAVPSASAAQVRRIVLRLDR